MRVCSPHPPVDPLPACFYRPADRPCQPNGNQIGRWPNAPRSPAPDPHYFCGAAQALAARVYAVPVPALRHPTRGFARIALARQVAMYLANVAGGVTLTDVGHAFGRDRTTVAHACALVEDLRDDAAIDLALTLLEQSLRASFRLDGRGHRDVAVRSTKTPTSTRRMDPMTPKAAVDAATRRLLKQLSARGAWLARPASDATGAVAYRLMRTDGQTIDVDVSSDLVPAGLVHRATQRGWIGSPDRASADRGEGRITLTAAGAECLRRALAGGPASGSPSKPAPSRPRPLQRPERLPPTETSPGVNEAESPLGWLRSRKDKHGQPLVGDEQFAAGERLGADVFFAGLSPRITANWSGAGGDRGSRRSAPGGSAQMLDTVVAARQRVDRAMRAVGPDLSGVLLDVCGFMKGLERIEAERGWPSRSAKVVLLIGLSILAEHYGLLRPGQPRHGRQPRNIETRH